MFNNIGGNIKNLASAFAWIGIIASVILGISIMQNGDQIGLLIILAGSFVSWISAFALYGFGELIDNSAIIAKELRENKNTK